MYRLDFYIELRIESEPAMVLRKSVQIPFVPAFGMNIETDTITFEINRLGYSLKDQAFFSILEDQNIEQEDLALTAQYWIKSGFTEVDMEIFKSKESTVG